MITTEGWKTESFREGHQTNSESYESETNQ